MATKNLPEKTVRLAAVGDLLLCKSREAVSRLRDPALISPELHGILADCDVVFANLEFTLSGDGRHVRTEPRVVGEAEFARWVAAAGFNVLTLANNHAFDCLDSGFQELRVLLGELGLQHFGAGMNLQEAAAPALVEVNGLRLAFLAAVDERSGPYRFAANGQWGVAPLDMDRLVRQIGNLRSQVNHVLVSVHWGEERFLVPSPLQIEQAHALVEAGASMVLGHHPHVLQGLEMHRGAPIIYSLGNFVADDVPFANGDRIRWSRTERTGCILLAELNESEVVGVRQIPTTDTGRLAEQDASGFGAGRIERVNRAVARGVSPARYRREHLWVKTIKPILNHLRWSELKRVRLGQLRRMMGNLFRALRAR
jgi:poly-gamma-glutamate capsule biosynthesis protein CapA/YwtB (metallophosphatase superfamily)